MKYLFITFLVYLHTIGLCQQKGASPIEINKTSVVGATYAVVVGISDYQDPGIPDLHFADKDAEAFVGFLKSEAGGKLDDDHLKVLINSKATMAQFAIQLDWLMENVKENDQVFIYFSGHGDVEKKTLTQPGYLLCWDSPAQVYMSGGAFALPMLQEVISTLAIQNKAKVIVVTDACHSGKLSGSSVNGNQLTNSNLAKQYANEIKILSCQPNEYSIEGKQWGGGRGAFSFHLIDALYGMADNNADQVVTLGEIGRYLEDHVTTEVAPQKQEPILMGSKSEIIALVNPDLLSIIKKSKTNQLPLIASIDKRGIEDDILLGVDTSLRKAYQYFNICLKEKKFFEPETACAEFYFDKLIKSKELSQLHSSIRRNYAATLQDEAQQVINIYLKADVKELDCIGKTIKLEPIPHQLERAAELLGEKHYMYKSLKGRQMLFEGIVLSENSGTNPNEIIGRKCLDLFNRSLTYEPNSAIPYSRMVSIYGYYFRDLDSAEICINIAHQIAPNWVLPYSQYFYLLDNMLPKQEIKQKEILDQAMAIDSTHGYVLAILGDWYANNGEYEKALRVFGTYIKNGGATYPCFYVSTANAYLQLEQFEKAENEIHKALKLDSLNTNALNQLAGIYFNMNRYDEAESVILKTILLDSLNIDLWNTLGGIYSYTNRFEKAIKIFTKIVQLDSNYLTAWQNMGFSYGQLEQFDKAETVLNKALSIDSTFSTSWEELAKIYTQTKRYDKAISAYNKVLKLDPAYKRLNFITNVYARLGRFVEAERLLNEMEKQKTNPQGMMQGKGYLNYKMGKLKEAEVWYLKSVKLAPNSQANRMGMALVKFAQHNNHEGINWLEKAIQSGISFRTINEETDLFSFHEMAEWKSLMKKQFPDQFKEK